MKKVKNISGDPQTFSNFAPFAPGEERDVTEAEAAELLMSKAMAEVTAAPAPAARKERFKAVEAE
jgi:hypothetical protein